MRVQNVRFLQALVVALAVVFVGGCASKTPRSGNNKTVTGEKTGTPQKAGGTFTKETVTEETPGTSKAVETAKVKLEHPGWIYFAFDKSIIAGRNVDTLQAWAEYLKTLKPKAIVLEGNTDDRGSAEYNLSLGERRAQSVKEGLLSLGVNQTKLQTVSYGEERPADPANNEEAWEKNRRVEFTKPEK